MPPSTVLPIQRPGGRETLRSTRHIPADPQSPWQNGTGALRVSSRRTKSGITLSSHSDLNRPLRTQTIQQAVSLRPCYSALVFLVSSALSIPVFISRETRVA